MKLKHLITATAFTFSIAGGFAINHWYQNTNKFETINTEITMPTGNFDYAKAWEEVKKFDEDRLPKSALAKVREIQQNAESEKNYQQLIKSYIFSIDYVKEVEEDEENLVKSYTIELMKFREVAGTLPTEFKALSYNIIAKFYEEYYNSQRWSIQNRTKLENDTDPDMNTWCTERFEKEVRTVYELSIAESTTLVNYPIKDFSVLIDTDKRQIDTRFRPTLFDYLAWDYLDMNPQFGVASDFTYQDLELVSANDKFLNFSPKNKETESMDNRRLEIYKMLAKAHEGDENQLAYVNATLERLKYYKRKSTNELSGQEYQKTLELMRKNYDKPEIVAWLTYEIADHQYEEKRYQESHKTAEYCLDPKFDDTEYGKACEKLIHNIELAELSLTAEEMVSPKSKFPIKAEYRNISKLYIKVLKLSDKEKFEKLWQNEERLKFLKDKCETVGSYEFNTVNTGDYQNKNSEMIINALPVGNYVILGGDCEDVFDFKKNKTHSICQIQSTNISIVKSQEMADNCVFYVIDRQTGEGIANANIKLTERYKKINESYKSDKYGTVVIPAKNNSYSAEYTISVGDDKVIRHGNIPEAYKNNDTESSHAQIFTDRAIYRPGQTIYWKVIAYNGNNKESKVSANKNLRLAIDDVNRKCIHDITIKTNEFGSVSGEFVIPTGLANGEFTIRCEGCYHSVSVEEYKRPKFEVSFGEVEGEVRINGKVSIEGQASTYSGENVADAKVKYTVTRNPQWRGWWYWGFNAKSKVIDFGEATTDKDGKFKVEFTAVPDPQQAESEFLQYNYTIQASVTDANGETRSTSTIVSAGYRSLFLGISAPSGFNIMDRTNLSEVRVSSTNINGQKLPAEVTVKVSRLLMPRKIYIPKRWESCENPIVSREDWERELPYTEYSKEDQGLSLLKPEKLLKTYTVNTADNSTIDLSFIKQEKSGSYLIELSATDKDGRPVKYEQRFTIYNTADKIASVNRTMLISSDKSEYKPGDVAHITIGTALPEVEMHYIISNGYQHLESNMVRLNSNTTVIDLPIKEEFLGGVKVSAFFIKENHVFSQDINLSVPFRHKELKIKFETFRDRLYPGEGEKWKLRISDYQNNPAMAEMLATLYDESLDALSENNWSLWPFRGAYIPNPYSAELFGHHTSDNFNNSENNF
ncbi:MAG: MG2 domain-containing protein, partial [Bacteroidales bacterium]|nr:MG2 domain-containing protein [Bacteroidales bacterium]